MSYYLVISQDIPDGSEDENLSEDDEYRQPNRQEFIDPLRDDEDYEDEYEDVGSSTNRVTTNKKSKYRWVPGNLEYREENYSFLGETQLPSELKSKLQSPIECFEYLFTNDMIDLIVCESNRYARQSGRDYNVTNNELRHFIGILVYMSIVQYPTTRHYWRRHV
jgi:hypothetical protein